MTLSKKILSVAVLSAFTSAAFAASTNSVININVTKGEIIEITGSANATQTFGFDETDVDSTPQGLGTLGVSSNITGDCTIEVDSANSYQLLHTVSSVPLHGTANYTVAWTGGGTVATPGVVFSTANDGIQQTLTGCDELATNTLTMTNPAVVATDAGTYSDVLTVTVTNE